MPPRQEDFAEKLKLLMFEQRMSIESLARHSGVGVRQIARYRSGAVSPVDNYGDPSPNAHAIARALGVPVEELLGEQKSAA